MYDQEFWDKFDFWESLKSSLEEAVAHSRGEIQCKETVLYMDDSAPSAKAQTAEDSPADHM